MQVGGRPWSWLWSTKLVFTPRFFVDDEMILDVDPGSNGFWELGEFERNAPGIQNPWTGSSSKVAPFDQEVMRQTLDILNTAFFWVFSHRNQTARKSYRSKWHKHPSSTLIYPSTYLVFVLKVPRLLPNTALINTSVLSPTIVLYHPWRCRWRDQLLLRCFGEHPTRQTLVQWLPDCRQRFLERQKPVVPNLEPWRQQRWRCRHAGQVCSRLGNLVSSAIFFCLGPTWFCSNFCFPLWKQFFKIDSVDQLFHDLPLRKA